ncbi:MAG: hypothetical protein WCG25_05300 [bacterium]
MFLLNILATACFIAIFEISKSFISSLSFIFLVSLIFTMLFNFALVISPFKLNSGSISSQFTILISNDFSLISFISGYMFS